eukprot:352329-Chlamydomonas_euryale.AAC.4
MESRHVYHPPHVHVDGGGGRTKQPTVLLPTPPTSMRESLHHFAADNAFPRGMRAPNVRRMRAVRRWRPIPMGMRQMALECQRPTWKSWNFAHVCQEG